jgi:CzcA family heavy metal efflux pump
VTLFDRLTRQRRFVLLSVALLSAAGVWAAFRLPSAIYPELVFPRVTIVVEGSSLGPRQIVFSITRPIEEAVTLVYGVQRVRSRSIRGASEINISFAPNTDMPYALQQVQARVNQIQPDLPAGVQVTIERMSPSVFPIMSYNLSGGDPATLYDIARYQIKPVISRIPGVGRVEVQGSDVREIEVVVDPTRLAQQGMTYQGLAAAIQQAVTVEGVGRVAQDYKQFLIVTDQEAHTAEDVGAIVVGKGLRVRDLAAVIEGAEDRVRLIAGDGRPAAAIYITRQIGGNTLELADSVATTMATLSRTLPPGVHLKPLYDQAELVRDAVRSVRDAMLVGALLAVLVLLAFLGHVRITVISAASIPLTLIITVFVLQTLGQTFNLMTLGAMAIAIGLVIDDAVVVTENIARHFRLNPDRSAAIREATEELVIPVTTSTLTTVVVFLPLGLLQGVVGQFFIALSVALSAAVLISLALALSIIPLLSEQFLAPHEVDPAAPLAHGRIARAGRQVADALEGLATRYVRALSAALHHTRRMLLGALGLTAAGAVVWALVGTGFLPEMDEGSFVLDYWTPGGTALAETDRQLRVAEGILASIPEVAGTSRRTGAELGLFATQQNTGDIVVRLKPFGERDRDIFAVMDEARERINEALPRLRIEFVQILSDVINDLAGNPRPIEIKLFGERLEDLEAYGRQLADKMDGISGLEDLYNGVAEPSAEMLLKIDGAEANRAGLTPGQVADVVDGALLGVPAGEIKLEDRAIGIRVRAPDSVRYQADRLGALPITGDAAHQPIPLASLATVRALETRGELTRENQQQMIAMTADISGRSLGAVMGDVRRILAATPPPSGVRVELGGQYASQQQAFRALLVTLALAAVSVTGVMVIQFESFVEPLIVLLAAPVSFVGALALLLVTGTPLNVSSFMGLILLVGLIVKNGIILLDFTRRRMRDAGLPLVDAIQEAARVRLRPILMTTLCTLFGLLPLALGLGAGSELQRPLALAVIGGLTLSTPITLFMVPTLLVAIRGRGFRLPARPS